ncbi:hypothetical protein ACHHYP_13613 [Achlya hypogyna]|uniref:PH domain-containing protein n=1 Tax=Achlya hypogyna TaxID=1202772 RepID=A0A1V9ZFS2_ACHHY|nr:hypothetical protein ACHHYP_13613 [Achlya hypogyna]
MLDHGVDITVLEGWLIKYNSKEKFFGSSSNKRWFKVDVANPDDDVSAHRLILSYYKTKKAKEVRGWIYLEDVTRINVKPSLIEIVSPARTLRVKGETNVEHKLWAESLQTLRFPPVQPKAPTPTIVPSSLKAKFENLDEEHREMKLSTNPSYDNDAKETVMPKIASADRRSEVRHDGEEKMSSKATTPPKPVARPVESAPISDDKDDNDEDDEIMADAKEADSPSPSPVARQRDAKAFDEPRRIMKPASSGNTLEFSDSEDEDDEPVGERSPVAQRAASRSPVKQSSPPQAADDSDDDDDDDGNFHEADAPEQHTSVDANNKRRTDEAKETHHDDVVDVVSIQNSRVPVDDADDSDAEPERNQEPNKRSSTYFDDEDEEPPTKAPTVIYPMSTVAADNNFVTEDWDDDEEPVVKAPAKAEPIRPSGGVAADANFAHEDWDD